MGKIRATYTVIACLVFTICIFHVLTNPASSKWFDISVLTIFLIIISGVIVSVVRLAKNEKNAIYGIIIDIVIIACLLIFLNTTDGTGYVLAKLFLWVLCIFYIIVSVLVVVSGLITINKWTKT